MTARSLSIYFTCIGVIFIFIVAAMINGAVNDQKSLQITIPAILFTCLLIFINIKAGALVGKLGKVSLFDIKLLKDHASYVIVIKYIFTIVGIILLIVLLINAIAAFVYLIGIFVSMVVAIFLILIIVVTLGLVLLHEGFKFLQPVKDTFETITYVPRLIFNFEDQVIQAAPIVKYIVLFSPLVILAITSIFAVIIIIRKKYLITEVC